MDWDLGLGVAGFTGPSNTSFGRGALPSNTTGVSNTGIGHAALGSNTTGNGNTALGDGALAKSQTIDDQTAIGLDALGSMTQGYSNIAIGYQAMGAVNGRDMILGPANNNVAIGAQALQGTGSTYAYNNVAVGSNSMPVATSAGDSVWLGHNAGAAITSGFKNVGIGSGVADQMTTGHDNVFVGQVAGLSPAGNAHPTITASLCVGIGYSSGAADNTDPSNFTAIGADAQAGANAVALGCLTTASGNGSVAIGRDHLGNSASSATQDLIVLGTSNHTTQIPGLPAFVAGDHYVVADATGHLHISSLGPIS